MKRQFPLSAHVKSARRTIDACVVVGGNLFNVPEVSDALGAASDRGVDIRLLFPWHKFAVAGGSGCTSPRDDELCSVRAHGLRQGSCNAPWQDG